MSRAGVNPQLQAAQRRLVHLYQKGGACRSAIERVLAHWAPDDALAPVPPSIPRQGPLRHEDELAAKYPDVVVPFPTRQLEKIILRGRGARGGKTR